MTEDRRQARYLANRQREIGRARAWNKANPERHAAAVARHKKRRELVGLDMDFATETSPEEIEAIIR